MKPLYCSLATVERYTENIQNTIFNLTPEESRLFVRDGLNWYQRANNLITSIAEKLTIEKEIVAGVIAVLSPNQNWSMQEQLTEKFIQDILNGVPYKNTGYGYFTNRAKAAEMILNRRVFPYLSGVKVTAFYYNLLGNLKHVTIDLWAIRIALNKADMSKKDVAKYGRNSYLRDEIVRAYTLAAERQKMPVATIQSLTWHIVREQVNRKN